MANKDVLKEYLCEIGKRCYNKNFVAANDGNISIKLASGNILITPTGVSKGFMSPDMLIELNQQGKIVEGKLKPSTETKMHLRVYREDSNIGAVVHAHPPYATAMAVANRELNKKILPEAVITLGTVPVAKYGTPSTDEVPESVAEYIENHNAVLLENHGVLTWGSDLKEAYFRMETVEFYARITYLISELEGAKEISPQNVKKLIKLREKL